MISGYRWRADRALLVALVLSLILHFSGAALYGLFARELVRLHLAAPHPQPTEQIVTISSAITFDHRSRPAITPAVKPRPVAPIAQRQVTPSLPKVQIAVPQYKPQAVLKTELSRTVPHTMPQATPVPKSVRVAFEPQHQPERAAQTSGAATLTPQQLAQLNADFSKTISQARSLENPLRAPNRPPVSQTRYRLQFAGATGALGSCEGRWWPIKTWQEGSLDYYYAAYECVWPDGTYEDGGVPWPLSYPASRDPLVYPLEEEIPLPGPPNGWRLPPGTRVGKLMRDILHVGSPN